MIRSALVAVLGGISCLPATAADEQKRPNVLFLITDDQFKDMMNWLPEGKGKNLTPNTERLAKEGTIMLRQYVTSPVCTPSRYSCLTGLYPSRSTSPHFLSSTEQAGGQTVVQWNAFITDEKTTMPRKFREAGYFTGIVGKNHVIDTPGIRVFRLHGFQRDHLVATAENLCPVERVGDGSMVAVG